MPTVAERGEGVAFVGLALPAVLRQSRPTQQLVEVAEHRPHTHATQLPWVADFHDLRAGLRGGGVELDTVAVAGEVRFVQHQDVDAG